MLSCFLLFLECHEWSAAPISARLGQGVRGYFRGECCIGGKSTAAPRVNRFLAPTHQRRAWDCTGRKHRFTNLWYDPTGNLNIRTSLVARAQYVWKQWNRAFSWGDTGKNC